MASPRLGVRRLDAVLQHAREPVFLLDAERRLAYVNRAWEELTGFPAESAVGLTCNPHGPTHAGDLAGLGGSFCPPPEAMEGRPCGGPTLLVRADSERLWRRLEFWPFHDSRGTLLCLLGLVRPAEAPPHAPDADSHRLRADLMEVRARLHDRHGFDALIGRGPVHRRLLDQVGAAAAADLPVLVVGEPGSGRRFVARTIHRRSARAERPLIAVDCPALPPQDFERTLFATSGNGNDAPAFDLPEGSVLLLTEVSDLPRDLQARLMAAIDAGTAVRLMATTALDLERARREERLRPDLYYALTGMVIPLAPLRERLDELPLLAQHILERANHGGSRQREGFAPEAMEALLAYDWPGNLRELARVVDHAHAVGRDDLIGRDDLPAEVRGNLASAYTPPPMPPSVTPLDDLLTQLERKLIEQALRRARQNKSRAAELLDISRPRLYRRIKELSVPDVPEPPDGPEASGRP